MHFFLKEKGAFFELIFFLALFVPFSSSPLNAAYLSGNSTTIFRIFNDPYVDEDDTHAFVQEFLDVKIDEFKCRGLSFYSSAILSWEAYDGFRGDALAPWVNLAYMDWTSVSYEKNLRIGRQFVYLGVARELVDGLLGRFTLGEYMGIGVFGGRSVHEGEGGYMGDGITGGRFYYHNDQKWEIGTSFVSETDSSEIAKGNGGLDGFYKASEKMEFYGHLYYDFIANKWYDIELFSFYQPERSLSITIDYNLTRPSLLIDKTSIFWVFSIQRQQDMGIKVDYRIKRDIAALLEFRYFDYDGKSSAYTYGGGGELRYGETRNGYVRVMVNRYDDVIGGYVECILSQSYDFMNRFSFSGEYVLILLDDELNNRDFSSSLSGDIRYELKKNLAMELDLDYRNNPFYDSELRGMFKILYDFGFDIT